MKKLVFTFIVALTASSVKADDVIRIIQLQEAGTLNEMFGDHREEIDSIAISGPMNASDWECLRQCCMLGRVRGMDLSGVKAENDSMPNMALGHMTYHSMLRYLRLPETLRAIGPRALKWCVSLQHVTLPKTLKTIGWEAFYNCNRLRSIVFPETLESVENSAFESSGLESVKIPVKLQKLGVEAFAGSLQLKEAVISARIEDLGWGVFRGCRELKRVKLPSDTEVIQDRMFEDCESLTEFDWPSNLVTIEEGAFEACPFEVIILPSGVTEIKKDAFRDNDRLKVVILPENLMTMDQTALMNNASKLEIVWCKAQIPPTTASNPYYQEKIYKSISNALLFVPSGSSDTYRSTTYWNRFSTIIEVDDTAIQSLKVESENNKKMYSIDGRLRRIGNGLFIQKGRKIIVK